ncbi:MAG: Rod shape-determining protein MreB [Parcubacteria group bacterium GW2011_GWC2_42_12]|nr:MAG: Rod shape-determining protein MreB [Parcubacteria group bacterium GW2011_GWC2_42_12]
MLNKIFGRFSKDLGIDLGTTNTLVYTPEKGIVINEPSVVAVNLRTDEILCVGAEAKKMLGKTPPHIQAIKPLVDGVISDFEVTEKMLKYFIDKVHAEYFTLVPRPRVIIGIPLDITEVEKKAVEDAAKSAIGTRLDITGPQATMIVDIGGGTTEISVISLGGVVAWKTLRLAGNALDNDIIQYVREEFNILIGEQVAENIKIKIGSATPLKEPMEIPLRGRDLINGLPKEVIITDSQVREAMQRIIRQIIENIKITLETTPPELVSDIYEHGIVLTGGGALLRGLDKEIAQATKIPVRVAEDPLTCVVRGTGILLSDPELLAKVLSPATEEY